MREPEVEVFPRISLRSSGLLGGHPARPNLLLQLELRADVEYSRVDHNGRTTRETRPF
jgi:hypothetical protein